MDVIVSGWLYKSPSDKKLWNPFKQAWQKRFFVLTHEFNDRLDLNYYESEDRMNKKGSIDLDRCVDIRMEADDTNISSSVCHLLSDQQPFKYIFSLKTKQRSRDRVYILGSESVEMVEMWMQCLRTVLYKKSHSSSYGDSHLDERHSFNYFKRPKSKDGHKHKHFFEREHSGTRWASFHAPKNSKTHKTPQLANKSSMNNLKYDYANSKSQNNIPTQQQQHTSINLLNQQKHHQRPNHQQQNHQQPLYKQSSQEFDYIIPVEDGAFQEDLNERYVLLDQCFSGDNNEQNVNNHKHNISNNNNKNNYNINNINSNNINNLKPMSNIVPNMCNDNYYNHQYSEQSKKYYNTTSDDNILLSFKNNNPRIKTKQTALGNNNPRIKTKQPSLRNNNKKSKNNTASKLKFGTDSHSCSNLPTNQKQHYSVSEDYIDYINNNSNDNHLKVSTNLNCKPPSGNCNINHINNSNTSHNKRRHNSASRSQVLARKLPQNSTTNQQHSTMLPKKTNYNSMTVFNNTSHNSQDNNNVNRRGGGGAMGFYTLPPKVSTRQERFSGDPSWYQKQSSLVTLSDMCDSEASADSNEDNSSAFTESSECPCKFYHCDRVYPNHHPPPQQLPQRQQLHKQHYNNDDERAYYNQHSLQYLELDLDRCSLNSQQSQKPAQPTQHYVPKIPIPSTYPPAFLHNSSTTQYTQIDINKTRGLQDTKVHLEKERRNSDKYMGFKAAKSKGTYQQGVDEENTLCANSTSINEETNNNLFNNKNNNKSKNQILFSRTSYSNISGKKNKKSYSSTVF